MTTECVRPFASTGANRVYPAARRVGTGCERLLAAVSAADAGSADGLTAAQDHSVAAIVVRIHAVVGPQTAPSGDLTGDAAVQANGHQIRASRTYREALATDLSPEREHADQPAAAATLVVGAAQPDGCSLATVRARAHAEVMGSHHARPLDVPAVLREIADVHAHARQASAFNVVGLAIA